MKNNEEALKELNMKCYVLSMYLLALLAFLLATAPELRFALRHIDDPQAITDNARNVTK